ncbi:hypothetical protein [Solimonas marina]|uniref:Uncharacterized protein n=1 Tax=Solimonas marina TaxID=2714601 RepID=A0A969WBZ5_9GAMM|nr:hypothetical protein [Solimonas marina]NKF23238.1 hypothetical protein [Solimonas marina]
MYAIERGTACPAWAADVVTAGWSRFRSHEIGTLGEAFVIAPHVNRKVRKNKKAPHRDANIADEVESLKAGGLKHGQAISRVAKNRGKSQKTVELAITSTRKMDALVASDEPLEVDAASFRANN